MALRNILDLPETLISERDEYFRLYNLGTAKTVTGNLTFISTTSAKVYNTAGTIYANQGQVGMKNLLFYGDVSTPSNPKLIDYMVTEDDLAEIRQAVPADGTITNEKLATDVKVGSLATLTTTEKGSVVGAINEVDAKFDSATAPLNLTLGVLSIPEATASVDGFMTMEYASKLDKLNKNYTLTANQTTASTSYAQIPSMELSVENGKYYDIRVILGEKNSNGTYLAQFSLYMKSGSGTLKAINIATTTATTTLNESLDTIGALGAAGSVFSSLTTTSSQVIKLDGIFKCTGTGVIAVGFKSTNAANTVTVYEGSSLYAEEK